MASKQYDLLEILDIMKANKVLKVKMGGLEVELSEVAFIQEPKEEKESKDKTTELHQDEINYNLSEEEMLKIASPFPFK